jgi:ubiquinone biosynthesis protein COQ4
MNMAVRSAEFAIPVQDGLQPRAFVPLRHPARGPFRLQPLKAMKIWAEFKRDKEQTHLAFSIFNALPWTTVDKAAARFLSTDEGRRIYASEPSLPEILDDHAALRRMPKGSLAQDYCDFTEREGLSAAGLVAEYDLCRERPRIDDKVEWYLDRLRDSHDLLHILTGFNRDALGEQCVLSFVFKQRPSWGHLFIAYAGAVVTKRCTGTNAPVLGAVREAQLIGRNCPAIVEQSIRDLLPMQTEDIRRKFGIRPPRLYNEVHRIWREKGLDPFMVASQCGVV